jgi:hypothetical protein
MQCKARIIEEYVHVEVEPAGRRRYWSRERMIGGRIAWSGNVLKWEKKKVIECSKYKNTCEQKESAITEVGDKIYHFYKFLDGMFLIVKQSWKDVISGLILYIESIQ